MAEQRADDEPQLGAAEARTDDSGREEPSELVGSVSVRKSLEDLLSRRSSLPDELLELLHRLRSLYQRADDGAPALGESDGAAAAAAAATGEHELAKARGSIVAELCVFTSDLAADNFRLREENADLERENELLRASRGDDGPSPVAEDREGIVLPPLGLPEEAELQFLSALGPLSLHHRWGQ